MSCDCSSVDETRVRARVICIDAQNNQLVAASQQVLGTRVHVVRCHWPHTGARLVGSLWVHIVDVIPRGVAGREIGSGATWRRHWTAET